MRLVTRGLISSLFWLGLALGFTGAVSIFLQNRHVEGVPGDVVDVTR